MTSTCIRKLVKLSAAALLLAGCGADQGTRTPGVQFEFQATPVPSVAPMMTAGSKTFSNDLGDSIVLDKAYVVIGNIGIETDCSGAPVFSMAPVIDVLIPAAHAHSEPTSTDTGVPYVIDVLATDGVKTDLGGLEPLPGDYCGLRVTLSAADADAENLPVSQGVPDDMVGYSIYIEGSYNGGNPLQLAYGVNLGDRHMLLSPAVTLNAADRAGSVTVEIQYDTWFNSVDPANVEPGVLFQNIVNSLQRG